MGVVEREDNANANAKGVSTGSEARNETNAESSNVVEKEQLTRRLSRIGRVSVVCGRLIPD